jgi:hypothetical protein
MARDDTPSRSGVFCIGAAFAAMAAVAGWIHVQLAMFKDGFNFWDFTDWITALERTCESFLSMGCCGFVGMVASFGLYLMAIALRGRRWTQTTPPPEDDE